MEYLIRRQAYQQPATGLVSLKSPIIAVAL